MIVTDGGRFGGYGLYLLKGKPVFTYNLLGLERFRWEGQQALAPGKHTLVFDFRYDGPGAGKGGTGVFKMDGQEIANHPIHTPYRLFLPSTRRSTSVPTRARRWTTTTTRCRSTSVGRLTGWLSSLGRTN